MTGDIVIDDQGSPPARVATPLDRNSPPRPASSGQLEGCKKTPQKCTPRAGILVSTKDAKFRMVASHNSMSPDERISATVLGHARLSGFVKVHLMLFTKRDTGEVIASVAKHHCLSAGTGEQTTTNRCGVHLISLLSTAFLSYFLSCCVQ